jgi:hypothetical protein
MKKTKGIKTSCYCPFKIFFAMIPNCKTKFLLKWKVAHAILLLRVLATITRFQSIEKKITAAVQ